MRVMKTLSWGFVPLALALTGHEAGAMEIVNNGTAVATVVYQDTADKTSAATLTNWIAKMTGVKLALTNVAPAQGPVIYIGKAALAAGLTLNDIQSPSSEGLRIQCDGQQRLLLAGQDNNSTSKAVCRLLEELGCRYLLDHALGEVYPQTNSVSVGTLNITEKPGLLYRTIWGSSWSSTPWMTWNGIGGIPLSMGHAWGNGIIPTSNFALHPEWFALRGGVRVSGSWYCTSNPDLREAFAQAIISKIAAGTKNPSISPPDGRGYCECAACVAQDDPNSIEPSSGTVNKTNRYLDFYQYVANRVAAVYPESILNFYCYADYTQAPTSGIQLHSNLCAWIAPIRYCRLHRNGQPGCESREQLVEMLNGWRQAASKIGYRTYNYNLAEVLDPVSLISVWKHDIPALRDIGCVGFNLETLRSWQIYGPHIYLSIRLAYDPDADAQALMDDYFLSLFGPEAGPLMQQYWTAIDDAFVNLKSHAGSYYNLHLVYTPAFLDTLQALIDQAAARVVGDATRTARVQMFAEGLKNARQYEALRAALNCGDVATAGAVYDDLLARSNANAASGLGQAYTATYLVRFIGVQIAAARAATQSPTNLVAVLPDVMHLAYDTENTGAALGYADPDFNDDAWSRVKTYGMPLDAQGYPDRFTHQWFRSTFQAVPQAGKKRFYLLVLEVDGTAQVFVNGIDLGWSPAGKRKPFQMDITDAVRPGLNTLAIHADHSVLTELALGGIIRPIYLLECPDTVGATPYGTNLLVVALPASGLTNGSDRATLNGNVIWAGGAENPHVYVCWDSQDKGTDSLDAWTHVDALGTNWGTGMTFSETLPPLPAGSFWNYRCFVSNSVGTAWSPTAQPFHIGGANVYVALSGDGSDGRTWATAYTTIVAAVNHAVSGDSILIKTGRYVYAASIVVDNKTLTIRGGYDGTTPEPGPCTPDPALTVQDADSATNSPRQAFQFIRCPDGLVEGLTITKGTTPFNAIGGGGVYLQDSICTFRRCIMEANASYCGKGAGIYIDGGHVVLDRCVVRQGIADPRNGSAGGGLYLNNGDLTATLCEIYGNQSHGHGGGGVYVGNGTGRFVNCLIHGNAELARPAVAAGLQADGGQIVMENCTIAENGPLGIACEAAAGMALTNSILWNNGTDLTGTAAAAFCNIQSGAYAGSGDNISADPLFTNGYRLLPGSPCINAGTNREWMDTATDLDETPRIIGGHIDLGAYESVHTAAGIHWRWLKDHDLSLDGSQDGVDTDGDGHTVWQEWLTGTDPTNRASVFRFTSTAPESSQGIAIRWPSVSNRFYRLSRTTNLLAGAASFVEVPGAGNLPATPTENCYTDTVDGVGPYFYKIDVRE